MTGSFRKILIANRGEIAVRIIRTARRLGYTTVAVFSDADKDSLHRQLADQAVAIGGKSAQESYLAIGKILDACTRSGADAVHPGYGFLSENADFARACLGNGIVFIGPDVRALQAMGNKTQAKEMMCRAGIPCIPGYQGEEQDLSFLAQRAEEIGFPLMIKAAAGGGGRGLRLVCDRKDLKHRLQAARSEAEKAFGSGELLLERALLGARHVEIQVFGDLYGNVIHLGERDCSIQRRHQKVFEESPSPAMTDSLRKQMGEAAVLAARSINYTGAGTVEFLLDSDGRYYFLEMNTRLQVEHPVTELVSGVDLVEWQIKIASGLPLPLKQEEVTLKGHAIEARLCAEDPADDFRPQVGEILRWLPPPEAVARTDHGLNRRDAITPYYDSLIAKIIACGPDRQTARQRLEQALNETVVLGIRTNREFLLDCLRHEDFISGNIDTGFIGRAWKLSREEMPSRDYDALAIAAALLLRRECTAYGDLSGWCSSGHTRSLMRLHADRVGTVDIDLEFLGPTTWRMRLDGKARMVSWLKEDEHCVWCLIDHVQHKAHYVYDSRQVYLTTGGITYAVADTLFAPRSQELSCEEGNVTSPSNGVVASIDVEIGQRIDKGAPVCTVEAMKLMQAVCAPASGYVSAVLAAVGAQVKRGQLIVQIDKEEIGQTVELPLEAASVNLVEAAS